MHITTTGRIHKTITTNTPRKLKIVLPDSIQDLFILTPNQAKARPPIKKTPHQEHNSTSTMPLLEYTTDGTAPNRPQSLSTHLPVVQKEIPTAQRQRSPNTSRERQINSQGPKRFNSIIQSPSFSLTCGQYANGRFACVRCVALFFFLFCFGAWPRRRWGDRGFPGSGWYDGAP